MKDTSLNKLKIKTTSNNKEAWEYFSTTEELRAVLFWLKLISSLQIVFIYYLCVSCDNAPIPMCALNALTIDVIVLAVWQQRNLFFKTI